MTIEEMRQRKRELGYTYAQLAEISGVPLGTVQRVLTGQTKSPRYETVGKLTAALRPGKYPRYDAHLKALEEEGNVLAVREYAVQYAASPRPKEEVGPYTLEDLEALPENSRMELIDGYFYDMGEPTVTHNLIIMHFAAQVHQYLQKEGKPCIVVPGHTEVQLDKDDKTGVTPDAFILCDKNKNLDKRIFGAPDLVLEVLSSSNRNYDCITKLRKYQRAGVREYWIADPKTMQITVYHLQDSPFPFHIYGMTEPIPVRISQGELEIDFKPLLQQLEEWSVKE